MCNTRHSELFQLHRVVASYIKTENIFCIYFSPDWFWCCRAQVLVIDRGITLFFAFFPCSKISNVNGNGNVKRSLLGTQENYFLCWWLQQLGDISTFRKWRPSLALIPPAKNRARKKEQIGRCYSLHNQEKSELQMCAKYRSEKVTLPE